MSCSDLNTFFSESESPSLADKIYQLTHYRLLRIENQRRTTTQPIAKAIEKGGWTAKEPYLLRLQVDSQPSSITSSRMHNLSFLALEKTATSYYRDHSENKSVTERFNFFCLRLSRLIDFFFGIRDLLERGWTGSLEPLRVCRKDRKKT